MTTHSTQGRGICRCCAMSRTGGFLIARSAQAGRFSQKQKKRKGRRNKKEEEASRRRCTRKRKKQSYGQERKRKKPRMKGVRRGRSRVKGRDQDVPEDKSRQLRLGSRRLRSVSYIPSSSTSRLSRDYVAVFPSFERPSSTTNTPAASDWELDKYSGFHFPPAVFRKFHEGA